MDYQLPMGTGIYPLFAKSDSSLVVPAVLTQFWSPPLMNVCSFPISLGLHDAHFMGSIMTSNDCWLWRRHSGGRDTLWLSLEHGGGPGSTEWNSACLLFWGTSQKHIYFQPEMAQLFLMIVPWGWGGLWTLRALSFALMTTNRNSLEQDLSNFGGHQDHI